MKVVLSCKEINARKRPLQVAFLFGLWYSFCMKTIFTYKSEIFNSYLVVCAGKNYKQVLGYAKRNFRKEIINLIKSSEELFTIDGNAQFITLKNEDNGEKIQAILLKDWTDTDVNNYNLLHEIVHYKQAQLDEATKFNGREDEFEAYFIESTFKEIREKLNSKLK